MHLIICLMSANLQAGSILGPAEVDRLSVLLLGGRWVVVVLVVLPREQSLRVDVVILANFSWRNWRTKTGSMESCNDTVLRSLGVCHYPSMLHSLICPRGVSVPYRWWWWWSPSLQDGSNCRPKSNLRDFTIQRKRRERSATRLKIDLCAF